jgi:[ribosomal protein S5]-alanine N-acetyltransferase
MSKNNSIETDRLKLYPLTYSQLIKYINCNNSLEIDLNVKKTYRIIPQELKDALQQTILPNVADKEKNYLFSTLWTIIDKKQNIMVGDICFKGEPNDKGEVEIGYGTYKQFQGKGYMTEAIKALIAWALNQPQVKAIFAETDKSNIASSRVLLKNGFVKTGETKTMDLWLKNLY